VTVAHKTNRQNNKKRKEQRSKAKRSRAMNFPLHSYFAELGGSNADNTVFELVQDNARVPLSTARTNKKILSKASRWHSGDSLHDMTRVYQCLPSAPTRRACSLQQSLPGIPAQDYYNKGSNESRFKNKKDDGTSFRTVSMNIPSILLGLPYAPRPRDLSQEAFDVCRALDDMTLTCEEDSRKVHKRTYRRRLLTTGPQPTR
jgi:hypothetical protein